MGRVWRAIVPLLLLSLTAWAGPWTRTLQAQGVTDPRVFAAFDAVRRADFLPDDVKSHELEDRPLPIGDVQTTSQPSLIAMMIQQLKLPEDCKVLEVGTGSVERSIPVRFVPLTGPKADQDRALE